MKRQKRKYERKIDAALSQNSGFLIEAAAREWDMWERTAKAEERIRRAKAAASIAGKTLLVLLLLAGTVTVAVVAPNIFAAVGRLTRRRGFYDKREFEKAASYLRDKKLIKTERVNSQLTLELTPKGRVGALEISYRDLQLKREGKWDGKWRIVFSDIPNRFKWARDCFRDKLKDMRFYRFQKSVYITPYPCTEEIRFLISVFNLPQNSVRIIETDSIEDQSFLCEYFGL